MGNKRKQYSLETRYRARYRAKKKPGKNKTQIAQEFEVPPNTLSTWLKEAPKIKAAYENQEFGPKCKPMKTAQHADVEEAVDQWFRQARTQNIPLSGPLVQDLARGAPCRGSCAYPRCRLMPSGLGSRRRRLGTPGTLSPASFSFLRRVRIIPAATR